VAVPGLTLGGVDFLSLLVCVWGGGVEKFIESCSLKKKSYFSMFLLDISIKIMFNSVKERKINVWGIEES